MHCAGYSDPRLAAAYDAINPPGEDYEACAISTKPRDGADAYDLEVAIRIKKRQKAKTTTYRYVDGAYQPVKK